MRIGRTSHRSRTLAAAVLLFWMFPVFSVSAAPPRDNPFSLPEGVEFKSKIKQAPEELVLQAIVSSKTRRQAIINNRNYAEGDQVSGLTILTISKDRVVLKDGSQSVELRLNREPFTIRTTPAGNPG